MKAESEVLEERVQVDWSQRCTVHCTVEAVRFVLYRVMYTLMSALFLEIFSELRKMDVESATNAVKEEQLPLEETDDNPYGFKITNIISLARDADGSCTTECVSGDCPAEVKQEDCTVVKQEPDDVCCAIFASSIAQYCSCTPISVYHPTGATLLH